MKKLLCDFCNESITGQNANEILELMEQHFKRKHMEDFEANGFSTYVEANTFFMKGE